MIPSELRKKAREVLNGNWGKVACMAFIYLFISLLLMAFVDHFEEDTLLFGLLYVASILVLLPLSYGFAISFLKLKRKENVELFDYVKKVFSNFTATWDVFIQIVAKMIIPIIVGFFIALCFFLIVFVAEVPMSWPLALLWVAISLACLVYFVARGLLYVLSYYILADNENLEGKDCVEKSEELMMGNRGNYFLLQLSFIGWFVVMAVILALILVVTIAMVLDFMHIAVALLLSFLLDGALILLYVWLTPYMLTATACFYDDIRTSKAKVIDGKNKIEK